MSHLPVFFAKLASLTHYPHNSLSGKKSFAVKWPKKLDVSEKLYFVIKYLPDFLTVLKSQ